MNEQVNGMNHLGKLKVLRRQPKAKSRNRVERALNRTAGSCAQEEQGMSPSSDMLLRARAGDCNVITWMDWEPGMATAREAVL